MTNDQWAAGAVLAMLRRVRRLCVIEALADALKKRPGTEVPGKP